MEHTQKIMQRRANGIAGTMFQVFSKFYYPIAVRRVSYVNHHTDNYHCHDFPQVWYCLKGKYIHVVDGIGYDCKPGSLIIVPPGTYHGYDITDDGPAELICLEGTFFFFSGMSDPRRTNIITNMFCHNFSDELGFKRNFFVQLRGKERASGEELLLSLCKEDYNRKVIDISKVRQKIGDFFSLPSFSLDDRALMKASAFITNKLEPMMNSIAYLNKHYSEKIHREDVIKVSTLCQTDFFRLMKKIVGTTYSLYLQTIRIRRAQIMITFSTFSFTYIADHCGFGNRTYMGKVFKKYYGFTMSDDRAKRDMRIAEFPHMIMTHDFWEKIEIE